MKRKISILLILTIILMLSVSASAKTKESIYPINCDSEEWKTFRSHDEMIMACNVDIDQLESLSTKELLITVLEYPLIVDILAYDSVSEGIERVSQYCTALNLFLLREDASDIIITAQENKEAIKNEMCAPDSSTGIASLIIDALSVYISQQQLRIYSTTVYTPMGSSVSVYVLPEFSTDVIIAMNNAFCSAYPYATFVYNSSNCYNCHSFAWYSSSPSNTYWMDDPIAYMSDGSYTSTSSVYDASRVYYYSSDHSAKVYSASPYGLAGSDLISKWGQGPVMIHTPYYGPYSGNVSLWR